MEASQGIDIVSLMLGINTGDHGRVRGRFRVWQTDPNGLVIPGTEDFADNAITNAMSQLFCQVMSRTGVNASGPTGGFWTAGPYIGLCTATPTAASTLGTITEASGGGYARIAPTWAVGGAGPYNYNNTASAAAWTAGTNLTGGTVVTSLVVTPAASGVGSAPNNLLMAFAALNGGNQTVSSGNTLNVTYQWTVS